MKAVPRSRLVGLLVLLGGVLVVGVVLERLRPAVQPKASLLGIRADEVVGIRVRTDKRELRATRLGPAWRIETPSATHPDAAAAVSELVDYLTTVVPVDSFERPEIERQVFGVEVPRVRIEMDVRGRAEQVVLLLGDYVPTGGSVYGVVGSEHEIHQIGALILSEIEKMFYLTSQALEHGAGEQ